ncbi:MAG: hypothetical protein II121_02945 [Fibrobacter sp.]|uniref:hypothetical protein n=1 Tax=uncultured Fibrobacter sp. TaxID=261512 RepID=UPI00156703D5|nr:hypothetical protein [uncultured Fibrobacter sp.]MBQ1824079.1 hypothetical protein [Fibrobacter sp.]
MKKILAIASLSLAPLMFTACGESSSNYVGYWQGEANMIFEVLTENGTDYIIRNINGDLQATVSGGALRGKNSLDMEYVMKVKGDSAYYEFGSITTGYKRISKSQYDEIFAAQKKASQD